MNSNLKKQYIIASLTIAVLAFLAWLFMLGGPVFYFNFKQVQPGDSRESVLRRLGTPQYEGPEFKLGQEGGFEKEYAAARESASVVYLSWFRGIDLVFTIGIDEQDNVTMKACGGT